MNWKKNEKGEHVKDKKWFERIASVVLPIVILIGTVVYLVLYISYNAPLTLTDDSYYRQALVSAGKSVPFALHGASWLYPCLLHMMLLIFGNTPFAGIVLQIILFFICLLLLYIGMQAFAGVLPAAVSMAALAFLPVSLQFVFSLTPEFFYLALYLLGFFLTGMFCQKLKMISSLSLIQYLSVFLIGLYIGFLVYLDIYSISLYFFFAILYFSDKEKIKQAAGANLTAWAGGAAGFLILVLYASYQGKMSIPVYLEALFSLYTQNGGFNPESLKNVLLLPDITPIGSILLISLAFLVIPAFFIWKRKRSSVFILNLFFVYALSVFSVFYLKEQMITTFSWSILAGLGLGGVVCRPEKSVKKEQEDEMSEEAEEKEQEKPAPGRPLHNPLPVPEKKKRPRADFGYPVKEEDMKFDIDVADDDDFDV